MNILDILILVVLGLSVVAGMYKGFLSSALSTLAFCGSWFAAFKFYDRVAAFVSGNNAIMESLRSVLDAEEMFSTSALATMKVAEATDAQLAQAASEINIPLIGDMFRNNLVGRVFSNLNLSTVTEYLTETLLNAFLNVAAFILVFIAAYFVATLIVNLLNSVFRFPQLRHLDWLLGGVLGAVRGIVILMLVFAVLPSVLNTLEKLGVTTVQALVDESQFAPYFQKYDLLSAFMGTVMRE